MPLHPFVPIFGEALERRGWGFYGPQMPPPESSTRLLGLRVQASCSCQEAPSEEAGKSLGVRRGERGRSYLGPTLSKKSLQGNRQLIPESWLETGARGLRVQ